MFVGGVELEASLCGDCLSVYLFCCGDFGGGLCFIVPRGLIERDLKTLGERELVSVDCFVIGLPGVIIILDVLVI